MAKRFRPVQISVSSQNDRVISRNTELMAQAINELDDRLTRSLARPAFGDSVLVPYDPNRVLVSSAIGEIAVAAAMTNGQVIIGSTGAAPVVASILGTANQVTVTGGPGSITLSLPQNIHSAASPNFAGLNLSGLTASRAVFTDASKNLVSVDLASIYVPLTRTISTTSPLSGGGDLSTNRTLSIGGLSSIGSANQVVGVNSAGNGWEYKTLTQTSNQVLIAHGAGTVTFSLPQSIHTGASPTWTGLTLSGLAGTGTRLTTSTSTGVQGNATSIDGNYTFNGTLTFSSPSLTYAANRVLVTNSSGLVLTSGNIAWNNTTPALSVTGTINLTGPLNVTGVSTLNGDNDAKSFRFFSATVAFLNTDSYPAIFASQDAGGSAPFNSNGHLVFQARTGGTSGRGIQFFTGTTPTIRLNIDNSGLVAISGNSTIGGTLVATGLATLDGGAQFSTVVSSAQGRIGRGTVEGLSLRAIAGSSFDFTIYSADAGAIFTNPTGTRNVNVGHSSGSTNVLGTLNVNGVSKFGTGTITFPSKNLTVIGSSFDGTAVQFENTDVDTVANGRAFNFGITDVSSTNGRFDLTQPGVRTIFSVFSNGNVGFGSTTDGGEGFQVAGTSRFAGASAFASTLAVTGVATFTAAPVFNSVTASQFLLVDGSKALTSVAGTGSGSVVRATSPTIASPTFSGTIATGLTASRTLITDGSGNMSVNTETGTGSHVRAGSPTLTGSVLISAISAGRVVLGGASGLLTQDNIYWSTSGGGRIGIGDQAASPSYDLDIAKSVNSAITLSINNLDTGSSSAARLTLYTNGTRNGAYVTFSDTTNTWDQGLLASSTAYSISNGTTRLSISTSGVVTIPGAASLSSTLSVTGLATLSGGALFDTNQSSAAGKIYKDSALGLTMRAVTGSITDFAIVSQDGSAALIAIGTGGNALSVGRSGGTVSIIAPTTISASSASAGSLLLSSTTAGNGLTIGGDTNLYRSAANTLKTDDSLIIGSGLSLSKALKINDQATYGAGGTTSSPTQIDVTGVSRVLISPTPGNIYYEINAGGEAGQVVFIINESSNDAYINISSGSVWKFIGQYSSNVGVYDGSVWWWSHQYP